MPATGALDVGHGERQIGVQFFFGGDRPDHFQDAIRIDRLARLRGHRRGGDEEDKQGGFHFDRPGCRIKE